MRIIENEVYVEHSAMLHSLTKIIQALWDIDAAVLLKTEMVSFMRQPELKPYQSINPTIYEYKMPIVELVVKLDILMHTAKPYARVIYVSLVSVNNDDLNDTIRKHLEIITELDTYIGRYKYANNKVAGIEAE